MYFLNIHKNARQIQNFEFKKEKDTTTFFCHLFFTYLKNTLYIILTCFRFMEHLAIFSTIALRPSHKTYTRKSRPDVINYLFNY